ncbi:hypothetical protein NliqN6_4660 [Naganishia liquefaciens]|uniref:Chromatin modification-related protein EAF3 n=1 Tax=Naganishia liquefaciens TaxID=104408 RepID=A0A8H3TW95_9TREE|nr:hypothetical protein NliqN6_4660 [Naganishia liquefaciens]
MSLEYQVKEIVLCFHGPLIYEAQVLDAEIWDEKTGKKDQTGPHYFVHYKGWNKKWDEWVPASRVLKKNAEGEEKQRTVLEVQRRAKEEKEGKNKQEKEKVSDRVSGSNSRRDKESASGPSKDSNKASKKRTRDAAFFDTEEAYLKRPEIKIPIPDVLKVKLVDDWEYITKNHQLVTLPRTPNVKEIVEEFKAYVESKKANQASSKPTRSDAVLAEIMNGIVLYFDKALGNNLLYRFERAQYVDIRRKTAEVRPMSEIYGAEHLLRLFVNLPSYIAHTTMDTESVNMMREHIAELMKWMIKEMDRLFLKEYETTTMQYQNISRA